MRGCVSRRVVYSHGAENSIRMLINNVYKGENSPDTDPTKQHVSSQKTLGVRDKNCAVQIAEIGVAKFKRCSEEMLDIMRNLYWVRRQHGCNNHKNVHIFRPLDTSKM